MSAVLLAIDDPLEPLGSTKKTVVTYIDNVFTVIFALEAIIKIIALGFCWNFRNPKEAYILNLWNDLDFTVVLASMIETIFSGDKALKS